MKITVTRDKRSILEFESKLISCIARGRQEIDIQLVCYKAQGTVLDDTHVEYKRRQVICGHDELVNVSQYRIQMIDDVAQVDLDVQET